MKRAVMKWEIVGDVLIVVTTEGAVPDAIWNQFVRDIQTGPIRKFLGASTGATEVSSTQRKSTSEALSAKKIPTFVVTDDRLVRGVVTAAAWLGVDIKSFSWAELDKCVKQMTADPKQATLLSSTLIALKLACLAAAGEPRNSG